MLKFYNVDLQYPFIVNAKIACQLKTMCSVMEAVLHHAKKVKLPKLTATTLNHHISG